MKLINRYIGIVVLMAFFSCKTFQQEEKVVTQQPKHTVNLADEVTLPKINDELATIEFEEGVFEKIKNTEESVDLDELYASFENVPDEHLPTFTEEQIAAQVNALTGRINIQYYPEIRDYINRLTSKQGRKYMSKMLALSQYYFPFFEKILAEENVPDELKYAAVVESALIPNIISRAGAVGLWQFMHFTGRRSGLEINGNVDERCDMFASTRAAAKYMKDLYAIYGDWLLALAAYNCGPGNVNKAIARTGGNDFWSIYRKLPRETRRHIPKFIAVYYAFHYHKDLMIAPMRDMVKYPDVTTVEVHSPIHLAQVAKVLNIEEKDLAELNRNYLRGYIPAKTKTYKLVLPTNEATLFEASLDQIYSYNREKYFAKNGKYIAKPKKFYPAYGTIGSGTQVVYRVRRGDVLGKIARRFGTSVRNIKRWNGLRSSRIRIGQKLRVYASGKYLAQNTGKANRKNSKKEVVKKNVKLPYLPAKYVYHTVKKNENCWTIAKKYDGVTEAKILELNKLTNPRGLRIGQKLRIREKS